MCTHVCVVGLGGVGWGDGCTLANNWGRFKEQLEVKFLPFLPKSSFHFALRNMYTLGVALIYN